MDKTNIYSRSLHFQGSHVGTVYTCTSYYPYYEGYTCGDTCTDDMTWSIMWVQCLAGDYMCLTWNVNGDFHLYLESNDHTIVTYDACPQNCDGVRFSTKKLV